MRRFEAHNRDNANLLWVVASRVFVVIAYFRNDETDETIVVYAHLDLEIWQLRSLAVGAQPTLGCTLVRRWSARSPPCVATRLPLWTFVLLKHGWSTGESLAIVGLSPFRGKSTWLTWWYHSKGFSQISQGKQQQPSASQLGEVPRILCLATIWSVWTCPGRTGPGCIASGHNHR